MGHPRYDGPEFHHRQVPARTVEGAGQEGHVGAFVDDELGLRVPSFREELFCMDKVTLVYTCYVREMPLGKTSCTYLCPPDRPEWI
jgi:hypothetical protein